MNSKREGGLLEEALTHSVIGAFYDVHRELGFGFREYLHAKSYPFLFVWFPFDSFSSC